MSRIIVTGIKGFIGRNLVSQLRKDDHEIIEVGRDYGDIADQSTWNKLPSADIVIHLAARSSISESWMDVSGFMQSNLMGTVEALNYCQSNKSHMVYVSSYLYGNSGLFPVPETATLSVNNPYSYTKKLAEETCQFYAEHFDVPVTVLRPFNVYGAGQSTNFLIPSLIEQVSGRQSIHVKDLELKRDYLYVYDLIDAIVRAMSYKKQYDVFNIGSGRSYSGAELIQIIQEYAGTDLPVFSSEERKENDIKDTIADIQKAKLKLGWAPKWSTPKGIRDMMSKISTLI